MSDSVAALFRLPDDWRSVLSPSVSCVEPDLLGV
jgi:hypothetical protein